MAEGNKKKPEIIAKADVSARKPAPSKDWSLEFSRQYALGNISKGQAFLDSCNEFVQKGAQAIAPSC